MRIRRTLGALGVSVALALTACTSEPDAVADKTPEEVIAQARTTLDDTSGVDIALATADLPDGVNGITAAEGSAIHPSSFEGTITVSIGGRPVRVDVIGVDGKTYAVLPFTSGYQVIDPAEYGAPDPGGLIKPGGGVSAILDGTTGLEKGETVRGGSDNTEVLTTYTGTVPGDLVTSIIPQAEGDFDATYSIDAEGRLSEAVLTGQFYPDVATNTYTLTFKTYDVSKQISAP